MRALVQGLALYLPSLLAAFLLLFMLAAWWFGGTLTGAGNAAAATLALAALTTLSAQAVLFGVRTHLHRQGLYTTRPRLSLGLLVLGTAVVVPGGWLAMNLGNAGFFAAAGALLGWSAYLCWGGGLDLVLRPRLAVEALQVANGVQTDAVALESFLGSGGLFDPAKTGLFLVATAPRVARIRYQTRAGPAMGTGFLVGPDLLATCFHVVSTAVREGLPGAEVEVEFAASGVGARETTLVDADWLVDHSTTFEEDFALLRLRDRVGDDRLTIAAPALGFTFPEMPRGFVEPVRIAEAAQGEGVLVLQRPGGGPLGYSVGGVLGIHATLFRHRADTAAGSSGGPCFSRGLRLCGIHRQGETETAPSNKAIRISAITDTSEHWPKLTVGG
jgi:hypothetical protein